jgi:hypothetical protein
MAGSKTRFGFLGNGDEPPDSGESGAARTIIGHDIHLPKLPSGFAQPGPLVSPTPIPAARIPYAPPPPAAVRVPMSEVITESVPVRRYYKPQKSRLARFLGHWTRGGHFQSRSRMGDSTILDDPGDDNLDVPRDTAGRNVLLVLVIAALTFLVTFAIVKIRQRYAVAPEIPGIQVAQNQVAPPPPLPPQATPVAPAPVQTPTPVALAPAKPAAPTPTEKPLLLGTPPAAAPPAGQPRSFVQAAAPAKPATAPAGTASLAPRTGSRPRKAAPSSSHSFELPEHLKGELLPLGAQ